jgi:DNA polymerase-3 subunit epsilon
MRQVVLDTETTGLEAAQGHRIIEIGCVELVNRRRTNRTFHTYLNPERDIDPAAEQVHGISRQMLADKPRFTEVARQLLDFVAGAEVVIHNAEFDVGFLRSELAQAGFSPETLGQTCTVLDSLALARRLHPGQRTSLDALCRRYGVDNSAREVHGALLDAELLAEVYLAMTGGQASLSLDAAPAVSLVDVSRVSIDRTGLRLRVVRASAEEAAAHERQMAVIDRASGGSTVWRGPRADAAGEPPAG